MGTPYSPPHYDIHHSPSHYGAHHTVISTTQSSTRTLTTQSTTLWYACTTQFTTCMQCPTTQPCNTYHVDHCNTGQLEPSTVSYNLDHKSIPSLSISADLNRSGSSYTTVYLNGVTNSNQHLKHLSSFILQ